MHDAVRSNQPRWKARSRRVTGTVWAIAIGLAFVVHGTLLGAANGVGLGLIGGFAPDDTRPDTDEELAQVDLETRCSGDVLLATSARMAGCMAPWKSDPATCLEDVEMMMWMDLSSCRAAPSTIAPVAMAMLDKKDQEKLTPIDPEPLLEELMQKPPEQQPPPPPQPQPQQQQPPPPPPPPQQQQRRPQQVVETVKPNNEQEPENARFLSEHNIKVDKQKVSRGSRNEPMVAKAKPEELTPKDKPKDDPSIQKPPEQDPGKNPKAPTVPGTLTMRQPGAPAPSEVAQDARTKGAQNDAKGPIVSDGFIPRRGDGAIEQLRKDPGELTKGQGGAGGGQPQVPNLKPTQEQLERVLGGGSVDHLEEVESGEETALSAKRWVYASFFNRLKRQVAQNWDPQTVWRRTDPNGTHHGFKTRVTEVRVTLGAKGELSKIVVTNPSGVKELDDEAVRSFHAAAPFPNPPDGLVKGGQITFAFSFYFEIGAPRTSWRVIRSN